MSWRMRGLRVTIPVPRGRLGHHVSEKPQNFLFATYKSLPTMFSRTELFPLDCEPTTAICGRSMGFCT